MMQGTHSPFRAPCLRASVALFVVVLWSGSVPAAEPDLRPGVFLYAVPESADPNFAESVVLLVHHEEGGSSGLIVNRPTRLRLSEGLTTPEELRRLDLPLHWGGPVQPARVLALVRSSKRIEGALRVLPGVDFLADLDQLKAGARERDPANRLRVYAGHAGWSEGQLVAEVRRGGWIVGSADAAAVFTPEPSALWPRVHQLIRRMEVRNLVARRP